MKAKPSYYAIIPSDVLHDKNVGSTGKILYAHLSTLAQKEGYAYPSNKYLTEVMGVSVSQIKKLISHLEDHGHITRATVKNRRVVYMGSKMSHDEIKNEPSVAQKGAIVGLINEPHNNTSNNTTSNTNNLVVLPWQTREFVQAWKSWKSYKKAQFNKWYKRPQDEQAALMRLQKLVGDDEQLAIESIQNSIGNLYQGLFLPHNKKTKTNDKSTLADALRKAGHL